MDFKNYILGAPLGYNLAVNTAMHAAAAVARPVQPSPRGPSGSSLSAGQGNCQPGFPVRPSETNITTSNLLNSNAGTAIKSEGHPGQLQRADYR